MIVADLNVARLVVPDTTLILCTNLLFQRLERIKLGIVAPSLPTYVRHGARKELE